MAVSKKKKVIKKKTLKKKVVRKKATKKLSPKARAEAYAKDKKNFPDKYSFGRPTEYCDTFPQKVYDACASGECLTLASICCMLEICRDTFYAWKKKYPNFSYAIKKGTEFRKQFMEEKGMNGMHQGKNFNAVPWLFLTKNMFPDEYRDRQEVNVGNKDKDTFKFAFDLSEKPVE